MHPKRADLLDRIDAAGGEQGMPAREYVPRGGAVPDGFVKDPFGVVFAFYSHSYELSYSKGATPVGSPIPIVVKTRP